MLRCSDTPTGARRMRARRWLEFRGRPRRWEHFRRRCRGTPRSSRTLLLPPHAPGFAGVRRHARWQGVTLDANSGRARRGRGNAGQIATGAVAAGVVEAPGPDPWLTPKTAPWSHFPPWHGPCCNPSMDTGESTMSNAATVMNVNPLFLRHDLMIELGRLEMAIDSARSQEAANETVGQLVSRCARINEALSKLPACPGRHAQALEGRACAAFAFRGPLSRRDCAARCPPDPANCPRAPRSRQSRGASVRAAAARSCATGRTRWPGAPRPAGSPHRGGRWPAR